MIQPGGYDGVGFRWLGIESGVFCSLFFQLANFLPLLTLRLRFSFYTAIRDTIGWLHWDGFGRLSGVWIRLRNIRVA